jgi:hypothetical protein
MLLAFDSEMRVTKEMVEKYIGYSMDKFSDHDFIKLAGVYKAIRDGQYTRADYFDIKDVSATSTAAASPVQKASSKTEAKPE